jgi:hypothetical protein
LDLVHLSHNFPDLYHIHPNNNRGTETQQSTSDFDANGNLLNLNNIGNLEWHYNNTLNKLTKADKSHQPPLLNQGLSTSLAKELGT